MRSEPFQFMILSVFLGILGLYGWSSLAASEDRHVGSLAEETIRAWPQITLTKSRQDLGWIWTERLRTNRGIAERC